MLRILLLSTWNGTAKPRNSLAIHIKKLIGEISNIMMRTHDVDVAWVRFVQSISEWNWKRKKNLWAIKFQSIILCIFFSFGLDYIVVKNGALDSITGINRSVTGGHSSCILATCTRIVVEKKNTASNKSTSSLRGHSVWTGRLSSEHLQFLSSYIIRIVRAARPSSQETDHNKFFPFLANSSLS